MKKKLLIFSFCLVCLVYSKVNAQNINLLVNIEYYKAQAYLEQKGEVYFTFNITIREELSTLTQIISIDNVKNLQVWAYANSKEFKQFLGLGYDYTVLTHSGDLLPNMAMKNGDEKGSWQFDTYLTYPQYVAMMDTFQILFPNICKIIQVGTTVKGRKLLFAKISNNVNIREAEPRFMYLSTMHGNETTGYILMLRLINYLITNYGTNAEVTNLVNTMEIWINPLENPDGTYAGGDNMVNGATRYNGNNIDMNRNYPDPRAGAHPDGNSYQPEVVAMMALADSIHFVSATNFHGGSEVCNYPYDTWISSQKTHADDNWWQHVCREFADTVHLYGSTIMTAENNGITEGGDWYVITGGRQDYMNYYKYCREFTCELSYTKLLPANQLPTFWRYYIRSFINYVKEAVYGFSGIVTDSCSGQPIVAKVFINTHDRDSSHVYTEAGLGDYYRPVMPGTYSVTYSASGFVSKTYNVTVTSNNITTRDVKLNPLHLTSTQNVTICQGDSLTINLNTYTTTGVYTDILTSSNGCDSIVTTNLIVNSVYRIPVTASINQGQTYTLPDNSIIDTTGIYTTILQTQNGCDSIIITNLTVLESVNIAPVANAGSDQSVNEGITVSLDGTGSIDADNDVLTYKWTAPEGIILSSTTKAEPTFTAPDVISNTYYTFSLVVNDGSVDSPTDQVIVTIKNLPSTVQQTLSLNTGWNIISANVVPVNLNLKDIFQALIDAGKLKKVMDETGKTIENFGAFGGWKNNIGNLNSTKGYKVNVTTASTLSLEGVPVPLPLDINLAAGWNIIAYPSANIQDAKALVKMLIDEGKLKKVMDESGKTIENFGSFGGWKNNIGNFLPNKGYKVNVTETCMLTIPASGTKSALVIPELLASEHFKPVFTGNGTDHMNIHLVNLPASGLLAGNEIGVFDVKNCVGSATIGVEQLMDGSISIPASSNDELSETVDGFATGHPIELLLYRDGQTYQLYLEKLSGKEAFEKNGSLFAMVNTNELTTIQTSDNSAQFKCFPNPFTSEITIEVQNPKQIKITVEIYNMTGQRIKSLFKGIYTNHLLLKWNGTNYSGQQVAPGVYLCKVNGQSKQVIFEGGKGSK